MQGEHDAHLEAVLKCLVSAGVTLNPGKSEFSKPELKSLGHIINCNGVIADPAKTNAILHKHECVRNAAFCQYD